MWARRCRNTIYPLFKGYSHSFSNTVTKDSSKIFDNQWQLSENMTISAGKFAGQALGSCVCTYGGSVVHVAVTSNSVKDPTEDFLPLTVDFRYRSSARGVFPTNQARRDKHGSDEEILVSRIIDRSIRPLFPKGYVDEVQVLGTTHSVDGVHDPVIAAVNAASFALMQSRLPWFGPIGCVRIGRIDGNFVVNPSLADMERSTLDLVFAGTSHRPLM